MENEVSNNPAHHRYELNVDGHLAATYYEIADGVIIFIHTKVAIACRRDAASGDGAGG
jgi:uncharacterized protein